MLWSEKRETIFEVSMKNYLLSDFSGKQTQRLSSYNILTYNIFMFFSALDAAKREMEALKTSLEEEKIQSAQGRLF